MKEASAVKDLHPLTDGEWYVFKDLTQKRPNQLREISQLDSLQIRGVRFNAQMLRAGEIKIYSEYATAPNFNVLEDRWRANNSKYSDGREVDQNKILFAKAFGITRLAGIFAIDGYKPLEENLVSWRIFILTKLRDIVSKKLESDSKEYLQKWSLFQRHARMYIGLILADAGERGLHEEHENKQQLFQEAWDSFGEAQKFSTSMNLVLFKLYLTCVKGFVPQGYDEDTIKIQNEDLWQQYTAVKSAATVPQFLRKKSHGSVDDEVKVVRALGPTRKGSRHSKGANIQTQIEEALLSVRMNSFRAHGDTAEASVVNPREDGESGARGGEDEDGGGYGQLMQASGSSEDLRRLRGDIASPQCHHFLGSFSSPQTPRSSFSEGAASSSFSLFSPRTPGRMSLKEHRIGRGLDFPENDEAYSLDFGQRTVSDPLATSINFQEMRSLRDSRDETEEATLGFSETMRTGQSENVEEDSPSQRQEMVQEVPSYHFSGAMHSFSGAAKAEDFDEEEESDSEDDSSMSHEGYGDDDSEEDLENDDSQSDEEASEKESEERKGGHKKRKLMGSNAEIRVYMEENSESLRSDLLKLQDKGWMLSQLAGEIEARSEKKFSDKSRACAIIHAFLDKADTPLNRKTFINYLSDSRADLVSKIKLWNKQAKQLSTREIAERIVKEGNLNVIIFSSQIKSTWTFLKRNHIEISLGKTILDVLTDQDDKTLKEFFQRIDLKFREGLKQGKYKKKKYIPLVRNEIETFASGLHGTSLVFRSDHVARRSIMKYLDKFQIEFPGKVKKTSMADFLRDPRNKEFIRAQLIRIAPRWASETDRGALVTKFEEVVSQYAHKECKFSNPRVGYNRLTVLLNDNTEKEGGTYKLKPLKKRERKRKY